VIKLAEIKTQTQRIQFSKEAAERSENIMKEHDNEIGHALFGAVTLIYQELEELSKRLDKLEEKEKQ
jgi:hypothetical protein